MNDDNNSGYVRALKAAGFNVLDYIEFGSYQGDWFCFVEFEGKLGFIRDSYGSCSGCDQFHADCDEEKPGALEAFGKNYIDQMIDYNQALQYASKHSDWDQEAIKMVDWVKSHQYATDFDKIIKE